MNIDLALAYLRRAMNDSGAWGYASGAISVVEPTAAAAVAVFNAGFSDEASRAMMWLTETQNPDGGWGIHGGDAESGWQTAWALLALSHVGRLRSQVDVAVRWLLNVEILRVEDDQMQQDFRRTTGIDITMRGWPWLSGEACWVEPTAIAALALQKAVPSQAAGRLSETVRFLHDRRCVGGGWNVGSPVMLGAALPARAVPTAIALLALQRLSPSSILPDDVAVLRAEMRTDGGPLAHAWGLLALRTLEVEDPALDTSLSDLQQPDGSFGGGVLATALAALATMGFSL